jgi:hypothetical protein
VRGGFNNFIGFSLIKVMEVFNLFYATLQISRLEAMAFPDSGKELGNQQLKPIIPGNRKILLEGNIQLSNHPPRVSTHWEAPHMIFPGISFDSQDHNHTYLDIWSGIMGLCQ